MQVVSVNFRRPIEMLVRNGRKFSDKTYLKFCADNPGLRCERTPEGEIALMPPAGGESSHRSYGVARQLGNWAERAKRGWVFDSSVQFFLPDGSALSPDAAWVSNASLDRVPYEERRRFMHLCPEFVIEVMSPTDRLNAAKAKMEQWIANGVQLAWLIDGDHQTVYVYQPNQPVETRKGILKLAGKGPVKGFTLQLRTIWQGLR